LYVLVAHTVVDTVDAMQTNRLRKLQQPSRIETLLEALISRSDLLPAGAYQVRDVASLPQGLRRIANLATEKGRVWSCWAHSFRTWLFTGEMSLAMSRERAAPVLQVDLFDEDGIKDSGQWTPDRAGKWCRCSE
jgi:hypothetical protein